MKVNFTNDGDKKAFEKYYYPLFVRQGFSWRMFPDLSVYVDMQYPGWEDGTNTNNEHTNLAQKAIFARITNREEFENLGMEGLTYERYQSALPSSLIHEIGHWIHLTEFGADGSLLWAKACALMQKPMDFERKKAGNYWYKPSYENFANHFENCVEGRISDEPFMQFIRSLYGIKYKLYTDKDYIIQDDRAYVPMRRLVEDFKDQRIRDIEWLYDTREVVVISAESGFDS